MTKSSSERHPGGRPSKYRKEYADENSDKSIIAYFKKDVLETRTVVIEGKNWTKTETKEEAAFFPTIEGYANSIGVNDDTIVEWATTRYPEDYSTKSLRGKLRYPEFSAAYARAKAIQKDITIRYGITGKLDTRFAVFFANTNLGMATKAENEEHVTITTRKHKKDGK